MTADNVGRAPDATPAAPADALRPTAYAYYVIVIICLANILNVSDRSVLTLLLQPIKEELHASDTAMSILSGASFVLFYSLFGIPIARWADRGDRRMILALGCAVWSIMTSLCGFAQNFVQMAMARAGVGMGESAGTPTSMSLIADYFPRELRTQMVSVFQLAASIGGLALTPLIGVLADHYGWRAAMIIMGIPGVFVALLVFFTVREPKRGAMDPGRGASLKPATLKGAVKAMRDQPAFVWLLIGLCITNLGAGTFGAWGSALAMRTFHVTATQIGSIQAPLGGLAGILGTLGGGALTPWVAKMRDNQRWMILLPIISSFFMIPAGVLFGYAPTWPIMIVGGMMGGFTVAFRLAPYMALAMELVPANARGMAAAAVLISTSVVGSAGGPLVTGMISDWLTPTHGPVEALRLAFLFAPFTFIVGMPPYFVALSHYGKHGPLKPVAQSA